MSDRQAIGRAALVVSAGILLSRVLGYARNVLLFGLLDVSAEKDLYDAAFSIPDYLFFLMAGGYLSITLVPILSRLHADATPVETRRAFTAVFRIVALALGVLTAAMLIGAGPLVRLVFPQVADHERLTELTRIALGSQVFFGTGALLMAAQYARQRFLIPTLAPLIYNLAILSGGAVGWAAGDPSPEAFLWGGLIGAAVGNFGLQWWGAHRVGIGMERSVGWRHPVVAQYFSMALPLMIGQSVVALDEQWPRWFGQLAGEGAIGALIGARQLNMLPVGVIAQAAGVASYPFLAKLVAEGRTGELRRTVGASATAALAVAGLAAALVMALAFPIVRVAYQYGRFDAADTETLGVLLTIYALSIPFWAMHQIYTRGFYAERRMWTPVLVGTGVTAVALPVLWWLVTEMGASGVALGSSAGVVLYTLAIGVAWHRDGPAGEARSVLAVAAKVAMASALAGGAALGTLVVGRAAGANEPVVLVGGTLVGTAVYLLAARPLGLGQVNAVMSRIGDRFRTHRG